MDNHFECMWDLFRSIPSIETDGVSVLDEYYWLNKADPNYSFCRATEKQGQDAHISDKEGDYIKKNNVRLHRSGNLCRMALSYGSSRIRH